MKFSISFTLFSSFRRFCHLAISSLVTVLSTRSSLYAAVAPCAHTVMFFKRYFVFHNAPFCTWPKKNCEREEFE